MVFDYGAMSKMKLKECMKYIEEEPQSKDIIIEKYGDYVQKMIDNATCTAMCNFLMYCYDYDFKTIQLELTKCLIADRTGRDEPAPDMSTIAGGIRFAMHNDVSPLLKFMYNMQMDSEADLPFE